MTTRDVIIQELEQTPDSVLEQVLVFLKFLNSAQAKENLETTLLSEASLGKDWLLPEEDEAWQDL